MWHNCGCGLALSSLEIIRLRDDLQKKRVNLGTLTLKVFFLIIKRDIHIRRVRVNTESPFLFGNFIGKFCIFFVRVLTTNWVIFFKISLGMPIKKLLDSLLTFKVRGRSVLLQFLSLLNFLEMCLETKFFSEWFQLP